MHAAATPAHPVPKPAWRAPVWLPAVSGLAVLWNAYGVFQFVNSVKATPESLVAMGMTEAQAVALASYPMWMTIAFAVGTLAGLAGSLLLLFRRRSAVPVLAASLAGYVVLYVGDITEGVFAALGVNQVMILSVVVIIALALLAVSRRADRTGLLA